MTDNPYTRMMRSLDSIEGDLTRIGRQVKILYALCGVLLGVLIGEWLR
jgi:hypothetical protein